MTHPKIAHLTSVHPAGDPRIFVKECQTLAREGYETLLIVPHERDEVIDGVRIVAVSQPKNRKERLYRTPTELLRATLREAPKIVHIHDPELLPLACVIKAKGIRVVYDVHEHVPQTILHKPYIPRGLRPPLAMAAGAVEWLAAGCLDGVVAATSTIAERFPAHKTTVVRNYPRIEELSEAADTRYEERPPQLLYIGAISEIRGIHGMLDAMAKMPKELGAELRLAGNYRPSALEGEVEEKVQSNPSLRERVVQLGWCDRRGVARELASARVGLVVLHPTENYVDALPVKLFEYMIAGIPVVASDFPRWRRIVEEAACGFVVDPLDPAAIAHAAAWLLEHPEEAAAMGRRGREAALARYTWAGEGRKLLELYDRVLAA